MVHLNNFVCLSAVIQTGLFKIKGFQNTPLSWSRWTRGLGAEAPDCAVCTEHTEHQIKMCLEVARWAYLNSDICLQQYLLSIQRHLEFVLLNLNCVFYTRTVFSSHISSCLFSFLIGSAKLAFKSKSVECFYDCISCHSFNYEYLNVAYPRRASQQNTTDKHEGAKEWQAVRAGSAATKARGAQSCCENADMPWDTTLGGHPRLSSEL